MKTMETITSIFRLTRSLFGRESSFSGRLDQILVESGKRVIIFEYPQVLQSADTVDEATAFLLKEKEAGRARHAAVYLHDTDLWHKLDTSSLLPNREPREVPKESPAMKAIESITTFFRSADFSLRRTSTHKGYTGRLDQSVVHSGKRVIVFEYPQVLQSADTVEEATTFLLEEKEAGRALRGSVYKHDTDAWCEVDVARQQNCLSTSHATSAPPTLAP